MRTKKMKRIRKKSMRGGWPSWPSWATTKKNNVASTYNPLHADNSKFEGNDLFSNDCKYIRDIDDDDKERPVKMPGSYIEDGETYDTKTNPEEESKCLIDREEDEIETNKYEEKRRPIYHAINMNYANDKYNARKTINHIRNAPNKITSIKRAADTINNKVIDNYIYRPMRVGTQLGERMTNTYTKPTTQQQTKKSSWWPFGGGKSRKRLKRKLKERRRKSRKVFKNK